MSYEKKESYSPEITKLIQEKYADILEAIGENNGREGLLKTPERASKAIQFLTHGYDLDPKEILETALFKEDYNEMVIVKDISKLPRVVDAFARRLQVQERLTHEIVGAIEDTLKPHGVAVVIEAVHMCMMMRGVQKQNSATTTSAFTGEFKNVETRTEFLNLIGTKLR